MNWTRIHPGSPLLNRLRADAALDGYDPYLIWADLTNFAGYTQRRPDPVTGKVSIPVAVELVRDYKPSDFAGAFTAPSAYRRARFCTGLVPDDKLVAFRNLLRAGERFKLGLPAIPEVSPNFNQQPFSRPSEIVIGIIDHGCAFANKAFREPGTGKTRVRCMWDQDQGRLDPSRNRGNHWQQIREFGYGGELDGDEIDALIGLDESRLYREIAYEPVYGRFSHGTHVMDLACGRPNPLRNVSGFPNADPTDQSRDFEGPASYAPIVLVQMPYRPAKDTSGASLCVHILDALHYIKLRVRAASDVVVNLSDGALAGPHDQSSLLESAIDHFLTDNPKFSLVVAAGNGYEYGCHTKRTVNAGISGAPLRWRVIPDDYTDSFLEIWLDRAAGSAVTISVKPPGEQAQTVGIGETWLWDKGGTPLCCVVGTRNSPNGPGRGAFFVALAPTRPRTQARAPAPHGVWEINVTNNTGAQIEVNAWIERDNPALGDKGPLRQSVFVKDPVCVVHDGTLNSVATGTETIVVGGYYARGRLFQRVAGANVLTEVAPYSSAGPGHPDSGNRFDGPDVSAPSDESPVLKGMRAAGNRSGTTFRMNGTSVAAPIATRRVVNMLRGASPPPQGQVKAYLQNRHASTRGRIEAPREGAGRIKPGKEPQ